jgi:hypothetical protein
MNMLKIANTALAVLALGFASSTAHARTTGAATGKQPFIINNAAACLDVSAASVTNNCEDRFNWDVVLPIDEPGKYNPRIHYFEDEASDPIKCATLFVLPNGEVKGTPWPYVQYLGDGSYQPGEVDVPAGAVLMIACSIGKGDKIRAIEY